MNKQQYSEQLNSGTAMSSQSHHHHGRSELLNMSEIHYSCHMQSTYSCMGYSMKKEARVHSAVQPCTTTWYSSATVLEYRVLTGCTCHSGTCMTYAYYVLCTLSTNTVFPRKRVPVLRSTVDRRYSTVKSRDQMNQEVPE